MTTFRSRDPHGNDWCLFDVRTRASGAEWTPAKQIVFQQHNADQIVIAGFVVPEGDEIECSYNEAAHRARDFGTVEPGIVGVPAVSFNVAGLTGGALTADTTKGYLALRGQADLACSGHYGVHTGGQCEAFIIDVVPKDVNNLAGAALSGTRWLRLALRTQLQDVGVRVPFVPLKTCCGDDDSVLTSDLLGLKVFCPRKEYVDRKVGKYWLVEIATGRMMVGNVDAVAERIAAQNALVLRRVDKLGEQVAKDVLVAMGKNIDRTQTPQAQLQAELGNPLDNLPYLYLETVARTIESSTAADARRAILRAACSGVAMTTMATLAVVNNISFSATAGHHVLSISSQTIGGDDVDHHTHQHEHAGGVELSDTSKGHDIPLHKVVAPSHVDPAAPPSAGMRAQLSYVGGAASNDVLAKDDGLFSAGSALEENVVGGLLALGTSFITGFGTTFALLAVAKLRGKHPELTWADIAKRSAKIGGWSTLFSLAPTIVNVFANVVTSMPVAAAAVGSTVAAGCDWIVSNCLAIGCVLSFGVMFVGTLLQIKNMSPDKRTRENVVDLLVKNVSVTAVGAAAGKLGAFVGGTLGTLVMPGLGTLVGALIGGCIGSVAGVLGARFLLETAVLPFVYPVRKARAFYEVADTDTGDEMKTRVTGLLRACRGHAQLEALARRHFDALSAEFNWKKTAKDHIGDIKK